MKPYLQELILGFFHRHVFHLIRCGGACLHEMEKPFFFFVFLMNYCYTRRDRHIKPVSSNTLHLSLH